MADKATKVEDEKIVAVGCTRACLNGYKGMDICGGCRGTGSQLVIAVNDPPPLRSRSHKYFPNTERGYNEALKTLRSER